MMNMPKNNDDNGGEILQEIIDVFDFIMNGLDKTDFLERLKDVLLERK